MASSRGNYTNPPVDDDLIDPDDADLNDFDDPISGGPSTRQPLTGNIGSSSSRGGGSTFSESYLTARIGGEDRSAPLNTIDESVWATVRRDLLAVWSKMREVLWPRHLLSGTRIGEAGSWGEAYGALLSGGGGELAGRAVDPETLLSAPPGGTAAVRDWDLWGPLVFCLLLSVLLSVNARPEQREVVFSGVFAMVWVGEAVVTLQIKLLGGNISFAQSICVIGYTLFPLVIAALLSAVRLYWIARIPVYLLLLAWSLAAGVSILGGSGVVRNRVGIAVYPLFVFYTGLSLLCFFS